MSIGSQVSAAWQTARYNRDWLRYLWARWRAPGDDTLLTFRLRNGQTISLRGSTRTTLNEIYLHRVYSVPGVDLSTLQHVFDFGANMGVFALYVAAHAPAATITCLEPASANFAVLERNLAANCLKACAFRMAVSTSCEPRGLSLSGGSAQYALNAPGDALELVECADLAKVFELAGVDVCDFLKMDVEGEELAILLTTPIDLLRRIRAMAIEWHHNVERLAEVQSRLQAAGFHTMNEVVGHAQRQVMLKARQP